MLTSYENVRETIQSLHLSIHPPSEAELLAWICALPPQDKAMVRFLSALQARKYRVDVEELQIAGQTT